MKVSFIVLKLIFMSCLIGHGSSIAYQFYDTPDIFDSLRNWLPVYREFPLSSITMSCADLVLCLLFSSIYNPDRSQSSSLHLWYLVASTRAFSSIILSSHFRSNLRFFNFVLVAWLISSEEHPMYVVSRMRQAVLKGVAL